MSAVEELEQAIKELNGYAVGMRHAERLDALEAENELLRAELRLTNQEANMLQGRVESRDEWSAEIAALLDAARVPEMYEGRHASMPERITWLCTTLSKVVDEAEVIGNVTAALIDLDASYDGSRVTFNFVSTSDAMAHIYKARRIVEERLNYIRALKGAK